MNNFTLPEVWLLGSILNSLHYGHDVPYVPGLQRYYDDLLVKLGKWETEMRRG